MQIPRITIAGTNSGCGKTTLSMGIMAALVKRGLKVQPFKVGPDYIDPMFHTFITGRSSRNLDAWMLKETVVSYLFARNSAAADIAVMEGVMGLYDGFGGYSQEGSTAHVASVLRSPILLVVNGEGMSLSIAALIAGYQSFNRDADIRGVIVNNIKNAHHYQLLKETIEENTGLAAVGFLPKMEEINLQSRHLGLVPSEEIGDLKKKVELLAAQVEKTVDLELLLKIAGQAPGMESAAPGPRIEASGKVRIAVARDKAFNFYYRDNLDLLEGLGAELVFFSPLADSCLPEAADALYIGGGYPEVWAEELQENAVMREDIKRRIEGGMPAYAECGGLMYLSESLQDRENRIYRMAGVLPGKSEMTASLQRFGYVEIEMAQDSVIAQKGQKIRAHEFHYSRTAVAAEIPQCYRVSKSRRGKEAAAWTCGFKSHNLLAGYPHLHFWSNTEFAKGFVDNIRTYSKNRSRLF